MTTITVAHLLVLLLAGTGAGPVAPAPPPGHLDQRTPAAGAVWPLVPAPAVVEDFRPPSTPYGAGHRGVDLAGSPGQVVRAAAGGRVTYAGSLAGRGVVVVVHGTTRTTYEPVRATVEVGTVVGPGDPVGRLETAGGHCAPATCLHWGLLEGGTYLDPLALLGTGPVRLLPLEGATGPVLAPRPRLLPTAGTRVGPGSATAHGAGSAAVSVTPVWSRPAVVGAGAGVRRSAPLPARPGAALPV